MANTINYTVNMSSLFVNQTYGGNVSVVTSSFGDQAVQETIPVYGNAATNLVPAGFTDVLVGLFINDNSVLSASAIAISGSDGTNPIGAILAPGAGALIGGSGVNTVKLWATVVGNATGTASLQYTLLPS